MRLEFNHTGIVVSAIDASTHRRPVFVYDAALDELRIVQLDVNW